MKNIVIIGGGSGTITLLGGLRAFPVNNAVIVSTADDGGSTGALRKDLGVIPPGDIRACLIALSYTDPILRDMFSYRFEAGALKGHTAGNILLAGLEKIGGIEKAIATAAKILNVRGEIVPMSQKPAALSAVLMNGSVVKGESKIDSQRGNGKVAIRSLRLSPAVPANPRALALLRNADAIVFGPGDLYTSTLPNLLTKGMAEAVKKSKARKIVVPNLMTEYGQTNGFEASDFVRVIEEVLGKGSIDTVIVNTKSPAAVSLARYRRNKSEFVKPEVKDLKNVEVVSEALLAQAEGGMLRHDGKKLAKIIWDIVSG